MWAGSLHSHCWRWGSSQRGRRSRGSDLSHCKADSYVWSVNHSLYAHISVRWILSLKLGETNLTPRSFSSFLYLLLSFQCAITLNQLLELAITSLFLHLQLNHHNLIHFGIYFPNSTSKLESNSKSSNPSSVSVKPCGIHIPQRCIKTFFLLWFPQKAFYALHYCRQLDLAVSLRLQWKYPTSLHHFFLSHPDTMKHCKWRVSVNTSSKVVLK